MGLTISRVVKEYKDKMGITYEEYYELIDLLNEIDKNENFELCYNHRGYFVEFVASEFNRYCETKGLEELPEILARLYREVTKPADLDDEEYIELEWW